MATRTAQPRGRGRGRHATDLEAGHGDHHAAAALVGEATLFSEAQLKALDRLGNRNGRYDLGDVLSWRDRCLRGEARLRKNTSGSRSRFGRRTSPRPWRRAACALALLLAATTAWSCTGDLVGPPAAERDPAPHLPAPATAPRGPGFLTIEWKAPAGGRAIGVLLELAGPSIEAIEAPSLELYHSAVPGRHRIVVAGSLENGPLLLFRVLDRGQLARYRVHVIEVTGEDYGLRDTGGVLGRDHAALIDNLAGDVPADVNAAVRVIVGSSTCATAPLRAKARGPPRPVARMGWTIAGAGWGRATAGVALALAALAGSHDSVRAQTVADSAGTTLSPPYSPTLARSRRGRRAARRT